MPDADQRASHEPAVPAARGGGLVRLRLDISYDGTDFSGWAIQPTRRTVAGVLTDTLTTLFPPPSSAPPVGGPRLLTVAGRTDAGVHATGQVAHLDVTRDSWLDLAHSLVRRLAGMLPADVRVRSVTEVPPEFDARFSALRRHYLYRLTDTRWGADPLRRNDTLAWPRPLDAAAMATAGSALTGEHDFAAFCRRRDGATTIRDLRELSVTRATDTLIEVRAVADAFCHSMVRSLVGALIAVGEARRTPDWPASLLTRTTRASEVPVAPAHGLTLVAVDYPPPADLATRATTTRRLRTPSHPLPPPCC